jgi:mannose-6-phosphate isomerase-like protein (cupin superfamily)
MIVRSVHVAFEDERGTISDVFYDQTINHVARIVSNDGSLRGNHYHKRTVQHTYVIAGMMVYYWRSADGRGATQSRMICAGELVTSGPNEIHAMFAHTTCELIVFSSGLRGGKDYEADTFREPIVVLENGQCRAL